MDTNRIQKNKRYNINVKDEGTWDDRGKNGGTNIILRIKKQGTRLILHEDEEEEDDDIYSWPIVIKFLRSFI
jgi:hypothetical protein